MHLVVPPELEPVIGEDIYIEQIVRNLVGNAAKYSPAGTVVDVLAEANGEEVQVRVLDRGPGIRGEDPERLFTLFYRAPSTAQQASGAGIGLFVCDQLVRAMGGRLWARAREGGGSEFGFALRRYGEDDDPTTVSALLDVTAHERTAGDQAIADGSVPLVVVGSDDEEAGDVSVPELVSEGPSRSERPGELTAPPPAG